MSDWDDGWKLKIPATGLTDVVNDTTPQLGGHLDPNSFGVTAAWTPSASDGAALGASGLPWSDLFLASGSVINWNTGDMSAEHSSNFMTWSGGSHGFYSAIAAGTATMFFANQTDNAAVTVAAFDGDRATPAANDEARVNLRLSDSAGNQDTFVRFGWRGKTVTSTTEEGEFFVSVVTAGTLTECFRIGVNYIEIDERTAPAAPAANKVRIYCVDNGAGKTRLMALFPTGAAQQIAIEP
jgi:hypothetical protein